MFRMSISVCALCGLALSLLGCSGPLQYDVSPHYAKAAYGRVGLLVVRVGNQAGCTPPVPITLQSSYANRRSEVPSGVSETHDVSIEEEGRLYELFPNYPYCFRVDNNVVRGRVRAFKNITPQLTIHLGQFLTRKGYGVVDLRTVASTWDKPISEMTVDEIIGRSRGIADAVFIFHYSDKGDFSVEGNEGRSSEGSGFTSIQYSGAMFDVATKERTLSIAPTLTVTLPTVIEAIANDPDIRADPLRRNKVVNQLSAGSGYSSSWKLLFSDEEIVELVAKYICYGVKWGQWNQWPGLDVIVP